MKEHNDIVYIRHILDAFMSWYNTERTNQGRYCQGRTPMRTFLEGLDLYQKYVYEEVEEKKAA